jgi:hypothetical protein
MADNGNVYHVSGPGAIASVPKGSTMKCVFHPDGSFTRTIYSPPAKEDEKNEEVVVPASEGADEGEFNVKSK